MEISKININGTSYNIVDTITSINGKTGAISASDIEAVLSSGGYDITGNTGYTAGTGIDISNQKEISVSYGNTSGTACQGNDSRLSDSRPASDVYSWAKAETKPSYSYSEISGTPSSLPASDVSSWAKANSKPSYNLDEVTDGASRKIPTKVSELTNDSGYLTSHQSLSGYATESWVGQQGYLTSHQSLNGYATESWVSSKFNDVLGINASGVSDLVSILSDNDYATGILNLIANKANSSDIPSSLPANGGNADTLDGYHYNNLPYLPDNGGWIPDTLNSNGIGATYLGGMCNHPSGAYMGFAATDNDMHVYTDGKFWQREGAYYCLDNGNTYVSEGTGVINGSTITYVLSAGNADTVDNKHAADFASRVVHSSMTTDIPTDLADGIHIIHRPGVEYSTVLAMHDYIGGYFQIYHHPTEGYPEAVYFRSNNTGGGWREFIDSSTIGSQSVNYANSAGSSTYSRYVIGDNDAANPGGALLLSGSGRDDSSPGGDTWIYYDTLGGTSSPWGIRHNQANNTIGFLGGGNEYSSINLSNGYHYAKGFYHNDYGSSAYALTSDGGVALISAMSVAQAGGIGVNNTITYGAATLLYAQTAGNPGTDPTVYQNPSDDWWSHIIMNHANSSGYYNDLAFNFFSPTIKFRQVTSGSGSEWYDVITSANIGSQSVNYATTAGSASSAGDADTLDGYHENSFLRYREYTETDGDDTLWSQIGIKQYDAALPEGLSGLYSYGAVISLPAANAKFDLYYNHLTSSNGDGLWYRTGWNSDKRSWAKLIDSVNIGSQNVNYANSAGSASSANSANQLQAFTGDDFSGGGHFVKAIRSSDGWSTRLWMCYDGGASQADAVQVSYANTAAIADTALNLRNFENNNNTGKDANNVTYNAHTYYTSNGPSTSLGASVNDGALYSQAFSSSWVAQIAQDYRNGRLFVRGKNNGTWQPWKRIANYDEIPTNTNQLTNGAGFITSSDSCSYASSAGSAPASDVYSWAKASTKPSYNYDEINYPTYTATTSGALTLDIATYSVSCITLNGNVSSVSFSGYPAASHSGHIIFYNPTSSNYTVNIAHQANGNPIMCPEAQDLALTVKAGGYAEIDVLHINGVGYFVRGV